MVRFTLKNVILILVFGFTISCTRKASESSQMQISLPSEIATQKIGILSGTSKLAHVAINVTGPGISNPIVYSWDGHQNGSLQEAPSSFAFDVTRGENRLVQVLGVYMDMDNEAMTFAYGDSVSSFNSAEVTINITLNSLGTSNSIAEGTISGRVLNGSDTGPTGMIDVYFKPPGKQGLIIDRGMVVSGWFSVFSLSGVDLEYKVNGSNLFGDSVSIVNLDNASFIPSAGSQQVVRAAIPVHVRSNQQNQSVVKKIESANIIVWGFWSQNGFDISNTKVCNDLGSSAFSRILVYANPPSSSSQVLTYSPVVAFPNNSNLFNTDTPMVNVVGGGGAASCSGLTSNQIPVTSDLIDGNGKDSAAGFRNIFVNTSTSRAITAVVNNGEPTLKGKVLPGVSRIYNGIRFFKRVSVDGESEFRIENPRCPEVASGIAGFTFAGEATSIQADDSFSANVNINMTSPEFLSRKISIVACGYNSEGLAPFGLFTYLDGGSGSTSGGGLAPATKVVVYSPSGDTAASAFFNYTCTHLTVEAQDNDGKIGAIPNGSQISFSPPSNLNFYTDKYCTQQVSSLQLNYGAPRDFWAKYSTTGSGGPAVLNYTANNSLSGGTMQVSYRDTPGTIDRKLLIKTGAETFAHSCRPVIYESWHDDGIIQGVAAWTISQSYNFPTLGGLTFYTDPQCTTTAIANFNLSASSTTEMYFYKYTGNLATISLQPPAAGGIPQFGGDSVSVTQPGAASTLRIMMSSNFPAEQCQMATVTLVDVNGRSAPAPSVVNLDFTYNGSAAPVNSGFYVDSSCTIPFAVPTIAQNQSNGGAFYFRWAGAVGNVQIQPLIVSGQSFTAPAFMANVGNVQVASLPIYPFGVSYSHPNFLGYAKMVNEGVPFILNIEARSPMGNLVVDFSNSDLSPIGLNFGSTYLGITCSAPIWGAGIGSMTCQYNEGSASFALAAMGFKAGGSPSPYPPSYSEWGSGRILVLPKAEDNVHSHKFGSASFSTYSNRCQPILYARGPAALPYMGAVAKNSSVTALLTKTDTGITGYYSDKACSSSISDISLFPGESAKIFYIKLNGAALGSYLNANFDGIFAFGTSNSLTSFGGLLGTGAFSQYQITMSGATSYNSFGSTLRYGGCSPAMIVSADSNGAAVAMGGPGTITLSATNNFATFYTDPTCSTQTTTISYVSGDTAHVIYIKADSPSAAGETITVTNGTQSGTIGSINVISIP